MEAAEARRAVTAATSVAAALDLAVDDAVVLNNSNRLVVRLLPCDIVARVSPTGWFSAAREVELARRLAEETDGPVAGLDPRVEPRIVVRDGFEIAMWTYFEPVPSRELPPGDYAHALERLHGALRRVDMSAPHFTDRLAEIQRWLTDGDATPDLTDEDRELLVDRLETPRRLRTDRGAAEQLLHGEPHPWNVLTTKNGLSSNLISALHEDRDGTLWIGTSGGGLNRYRDGRFATFTTADGFFDNLVHRILEDDASDYPGLSLIVQPGIINCMIKKVVESFGSRMIAD